MAKSYNICLDIGGTKILGAVFNEKNEIIYRLKKRTTESGKDTDNVEKTIINITKEIIAQSGIKKSQINAISAGAPGVIDSENGIVLFSPNLPWRNYDIKTPIEKEFNVPFYIGNDVNVGVLGEYVYGAGRGFHNVIGFFVGTGLGGGMILNDKLFLGNLSKSGEYGHMVVQEEGPLCGCGQRGCVEAFSSKKGMSAYIREQAARGRETMMAEYVKDGVFRSKAMKKAVAANDAVTMEAIDRSCHYLAIATGNMINAISPDCVVYGGGVIEALGDLFLEKIQAEVHKYTMPSILCSTQLKKAELGDDSNIYGSLAMIPKK